MEGKQRKRSRAPAVLVWSACFVLGAGTVAAHADSFRCGRKVVRNGDTQAQLIARCGHPGRRDNGHELVRLPEGHQRVRVERWHYKLGSRQLERTVLLYQGRVVGMRSGAR